MIETVSRKIVRYLLNKNVISSSDASIEYYQYGIEITISSALNIILILSIGAMLNKFIEAVVFLLIFIPLRLYTGGYHAKTYFKCNLYFCIFFICLLSIYTNTVSIISNNVCIYMAILNEIITVTECPVENKNKPLTDAEKKRNKIISVILGAFVDILGIILYLLTYKIGVLILYTHLLVSILIIVAMIFEKRGDYDEG